MTTTRWKVTREPDGSVLLRAAAAPADPAEEIVRRRTLRETLGRVEGLAHRAQAEDGDADAFEAALDDVLDEVLKALDPGGEP